MSERHWCTGCGEELAKDEVNTHLCLSKARPTREYLPPTPYTYYDAE